MKDSKVRVNGIDLHVADFGGKGETILCVHGLSSNCRIWDGVAERLTDKFRVLAFDLRGRGESDKPLGSNNIPQHVEDIRALLDSFGLDKVVYLGHSLGASIGAAFATTYPERLSRLILVDGSADVEPAVFDLLRASTDRLGKVFPDYESYLQPLKNGPYYPTWNPYIEQHYFFDVQHNPDGSVVSKVSKQAIVEEIEALQKFSLDTLHPRIVAPTLVFWSPLSLMHPTVMVLKKEKGEEIARGIPNGRFVEIEGSNHFTILLEHYEEVASEVRGFLEATAPARPRAELAR